MRIAIVNDVTMAAEALRRVVISVPEFELAWVARNGAEAVERCARETPDLILMDLIMPVMDGVEATRRIMAQSPCAILIVATSLDDRSAMVFEALGAGALDVVSVPILGPGGSTAGAAALLVRIGMISRLVGGSDVPRRWRGPDGTSEERAPRARAGASSPRGLVVIGASAGGPAAVATILGSLPRGFDAAIVVIQHVYVQFAPSLATWLNDQSVLPVRLAREGDRPGAGAALVAGTNDHLVFVSGQTLGYTSHPRDCSYRPSVDVFFESVICHWKEQVVGVLLTGMGRDGARGLRALRDAGAVTIAQDRASCAVYGMPKAAAELDAVAHILPLDRIASRLTGLFTRQPGCQK
jgi:two-component system response regulator WspF